MADVQKENGYTSIANELLEAIYQFNFSLREVKIILVVIRFTYGFSRKTANFSLRFLEQATKIPLRHVSFIIKKLIDKNILIIKNNYKGIRSREMQLNKNYETWLRDDQKRNTKNNLRDDQKRNSSVTENVTVVLRKEQPRKKTINKTLKKELFEFNEFWDMYNKK